MKAGSTALYLWEVMYRAAGSGLGLLLFGLQVLLGQDIAVSPPQKVASGAAQFNILGNTPEGILIHYQLRDQHILYAYYPNMQLRWKKTLSLRERQAEIQQVLLMTDSLTVLYTISARGQVLLYALRYGLKLEQPSRTVLLDTLTANVLATMPQLKVRQSHDQKQLLIWYEDVGFAMNKKFYVCCYDIRLQRKWKHAVVLQDLSDPELIDGIADTVGNLLLAMGDRRNRTTPQTFPYRKLMLLHLQASGVRHKVPVEAEHVLLSECLLRRTFSGDRVVLSGIYLQAGSRESGGFYFMIYDTNHDSLVVRSFAGLSPEASDESGKGASGRTAPLRSYRPVDLVVTRAGGAMLVAEAQDISTEYYPNPAFGTFGMTTGFAVSYFHFDDIAVVSFRPDGQPEWRKVLRKRQNTEGDGGYYSSIALHIAPERLYFLFNDFTTGTTVTSFYSLDANGSVERNQLFHAERMGLWPVLRQSRQVSNTEIIIPSIRKNYLQFVRVRF
ncbi:MAG: hypothetical protein NZL95_00980 [Chitinophagales bacterium]|nr:hypothetical protein [Chitinophagales bacterium]MDW8427109.1 hypothetical protein [Chitinophagales bacterium]